ncbi:MAG TPA: YlbF family regulator [Bacillus sp. (in: firmicutes)]|uniref:YlbF family regulator n=1 Tax=Bacillus litorisediminis TaxID=2922713 RepID=UPI001FAE478C|nr:YlbF family regulator [Bacillus litorisediminis]HWO76975.1 YlbF family regulator [Bacillus sp. (in: firmicutes)]
MSVNMYDAAHDLEKAVRQSDEFAELHKAYADVEKDTAAQGIFQNFRNIQMQLQQKQMTGQPITQEEVQQAQKAAALAQQNEKIGKLLEVEQRMSMVITELNRIIMKPLEEIYGALEK